MYSVVNSPRKGTHDNSSAQVVPDAGGGRFIWIKDVLPHELAPRIGELMEQVIGVIERTL